MTTQGLSQPLPEVLTVVLLFHHPTFDPLLHLCALPLLHHQLSYTVSSDAIWKHSLLSLPCSLQLLSDCIVCFLSILTCQPGFFSLLEVGIHHIYFHYFCKTHYHLFSRFLSLTPNLLMIPVPSTNCIWKVIL